MPSFVMVMLDRFSSKFIKSLIVTDSWFVCRSVSIGPCVCAPLSLSFGLRGTIMLTLFRSIVSSDLQSLFMSFANVMAIT